MLVLLLYILQLLALDPGDGCDWFLLYIHLPHPLPHTHSPSWFRALSLSAFFALPIPTTHRCSSFFSSTFKVLVSSSGGSRSYQKSIHRNLSFSQRLSLFLSLSSHTFIVCCSNYWLLHCQASIWIPDLTSFYFSHPAYGAPCGSVLSLISLTIVTSCRISATHLPNPCLQSKSLVFNFTSPVAYWIHLRYVITTSAQPSLESCCHFPCLFQHQLLSSLWFQISRFKTLKSVLTSPMLYPSMWSQSPNYVHFIVHCLFYLFFAFHYLPGPDLKQLLEFCLYSHLTSLFACILAFSSRSSCTHAATLIIWLSIDLAPDVPVHASTHWSGQAKSFFFFITHCTWLFTLEHPFPFLRNTSPTPFYLSMQIWQIFYD